MCTVLGIGCWLLVDVSFRGGEDTKWDERRKESGDRHWQSSKIREALVLIVSK